MLRLGYENRRRKQMNKNEMVERSLDTCKKLKGKPGGLKALKKWAERQNKIKKLRKLTRGETV